ncbi:MAG TPA: hypothetical protein ENI90_09280, partial [Methylothermaceae bacterium]|nr:hypothetical protein [Methylothermaceae bacterium]
HRDTHTIPLVFDADFRHSDPTYHAEFHLLKQELEPVLLHIRHHYDKRPRLRSLQKKNGKAYAIRMILTRLKPGGIIPEHVDRNYSLTHCHRIHLPLQSDEGVSFSVGGETRHMAPGEIWEINNRRVHHVVNNSARPRIHLITDWVIPGERCCCSARRYPNEPCSPERCEQTDFMPAPCNCLEQH